MFTVYNSLGKIDECADHDAVLGGAGMDVQLDETISPEPEPGPDTAPSCMPMHRISWPTIGI